MPVDDTKTVDQREWPLDPITLPNVTDPNDHAKLVITRTVISKDLGTPTATVEERWEAEVQRGRTRLLVAGAATKAEFDGQLNTWRQALVDIRATWTNTP